MRLHSSSLLAHLFSFISSLADEFKAYLDQKCQHLEPRKVYLYDGPPQNVDKVDLPSRDLESIATMYDFETSEIISSSIITLDFDAVQEIVESARIKASDKHKKPLFITTKGVGTGMTTAIEEMRLTCQLNMKNCLAIPITFNVNWTYDAKELQPFKAKAFIDTELSITISIVARMLSMFYQGVDLLAGQQMVMSFVSQVNLSHGCLYSQSNIYYQ